MSADGDVLADMIGTLDSSIRSSAEFDDEKTVIGGLYTIADELAKLTKQLESIANRRVGGGGAL